ncbi:MAG: hypothetical protein GKR94_34090 [Gammaproteobacteria bacterium]|nr:hypothetical protein [Gammaproteobacteria bacterium]
MYAGFTVWNVNNERLRDGYKTGTKRRPRGEWQVPPETTHEALITLDEAEVILQRLQGSTHSKARRTPATYLLTSLLKGPDGEPWYGDRRKHYRTKPDGGKSYWISKDVVENTIVRRVVKDLQSPSFAGALIQQALKTYQPPDRDPAGPLRRQEAEVVARMDRYLELACGLQDPTPARPDTSAGEGGRTATDPTRPATGHPELRIRVCGSTSAGKDHRWSD